MAGRQGIFTDVDLSEMDGPRPATSRQEGPAAPSRPAPAPEDAPNEFAGKGELLEEPDPKKVFKAIDGMVERQEPLAKNREEDRKHWSRIRRGVPFSQLTKSEDRSIWRAELPNGIKDQPQPIPNKADDLCSKIVSQVLTDPFLPNPKPEDENNEQDRGAADVGRKFLQANGDESGTNDAQLFREVLDGVMTARSMFAHVWTDLEGGGWRPLQIKAHPQAEDPNNPLVAVDPMTGAPLPTTDYVLRYVTDGGQFTDDPSQAAPQWMPKVKRDILPPANVRILPATADVWGADAVILLMVQPLSSARQRLPELREMDDEQLRLLCEWRPRRAKALVPDAFRGLYLDQKKDSESADYGVSDDTLIFWYHKYCKPSPAYRDGAEIAVSGADGGMVLKKGLLRADLPEDDGTMVPVLGDIPVSQCKGLPDTEDRDPIGKTPLEKFGAGNEALAQLYGGALEAVDIELHKNVFIPSTTTVQKWQVMQRTGEPISVVSKDDMPFYEPGPSLPAYLPDLINRIETSMNTASMLSETAQALDSAYAVSGVAKDQSIRQTKVALSVIYQNVIVFIKRYWRLVLQQAQRYYTIPQQIEAAGVDSAYKQRWWTGADFVGIKDVALQPGSGTMMGAQEKQTYLAGAQSQGWIDPEEAAQAGRSGVADDLGLAPNPHKVRIDRELAEWAQGPPDGWAEQQAAYQQQLVQYQQQQQMMQMQQMQMQQMPQQPAMGQQQPMMQMQQMGQQMALPAMQPPAPPWTPFAARPCDADQKVATIRYRTLRDYMATGDYQRQEPAWRATVDQAYEVARQAAGVPTVAEQQAAAAQQQMMQQQQGAHALPEQMEGEPPRQRPRAA